MKDFLYMPWGLLFLCASDVRTIGYRLADGRYFIVKDEGGEIVAVRQILFGCGIYPAPVKDVSEKEWLDVLTLVRPRKEST